MNALISSICLFSITGLFIRYFSSPSLRMRYISDASYWVYIIHMPMTLAGPGILVATPFGGFLKFSHNYDGYFLDRFYHLSFLDTFNIYRKILEW